MHRACGERVVPGIESVDLKGEKILSGIRKGMNGKQPLHWRHFSNGKRSGLAHNQRLQRTLGKEIEAAHVASERTGETARHFGNFRYRTHKSWSC